MSYRPERTKPGNWRTIRRDALAADNHTCQLGGPDCTGEATEVDHIIPTYLGGGHEPENLRGVCRTCHAVKSRREADDAMKRKAARRRRPKEPPPGLIR